MKNTDSIGLQGKESLLILQKAQWALGFKSSARLRLGPFAFCTRLRFAPDCVLGELGASLNGVATRFGYRVSHEPLDFLLHHEIAAGKVSPSDG